MEPSSTPLAEEAGGGTPTTVRIRWEPNPAAAGSAAGGGAPTTVRHRRVKNSAPLFIHSGVCSPPLFLSTSSLPTLPVPAVIYNVPELMGSRLRCTDEDRAPLCRTYQEISCDSLFSTGRLNDELRAGFRKRRGRI